jgi:release factor glutamine methyltransferase
MALDGGPDGLDVARRLVPEAASALAPGGALLVEADGEQAEEVAELFRSSRLIDIRTVRDLGGRPRVTTGRKPWTT